MEALKYLISIVLPAIEKEMFDLEDQIDQVRLQDKVLCSTLSKLVNMRRCIQNLKEFEMLFGPNETQPLAIRTLKDVLADPDLPLGKATKGAACIEDELLQIDPE
jgi:hypothetical protein